MAHKVIDIVGWRSGRLVVTAYSHRGKKEHYWHCQCDCGGTSVVRGSKIRRKETISCGSAHDFFRPGQFKHGLHKSRVYGIWSGMKERCLSDKHPAFKRYGGRGITICKEWLDLNNFVTWAYSSGYKPDLTLDRRNNDGNYEPSNCRWIPMAEQLRNRSSNVNYTVNGVTKCQAEWCRELGISPNTIQRRLKAGITGEDLFKKVGRFGRPIAS